MANYSRSVLRHASEHFSKHYHKRMFASFHYPSGSIRVYIDVPGGWPRIVMLDNMGVVWAKVDESTLSAITRKLKKLPGE